MWIKFELKETDNLKISTVSVIGSFNQYDALKGKMKKIGEKWILEVLLDQGAYTYKFLINKKLRLNDPIANMYRSDENNEIWSLIIINKENQKLYNKEQYTVHIENYNITTNMCDRQINSNKKIFNLSNDKKVVTRFEFTKVTGLHSVTAIWYTPYEEIFGVSESRLFAPENQGDKPIVTWFLLDLQSKEIKYPQGLWTMGLFIDGNFILKDKFIIEEMNTYSQSTREYLV